MVEKADMSSTLFRSLSPQAQRDEGVGISALRLAGSRRWISGRGPSASPAEPILPLHRRLPTLHLPPLFLRRALLLGAAPWDPQNPRQPQVPSYRSHPPTPSPLRSSSSSSSESFQKKRSDARPAADPFVAALAECAKEPSPPSDGAAEMGMEKLWRRGGKVTDLRRGAAAAVWSISDRFRIFGLVGWCKSGRCSVADSTVCVPRSSLRNCNAYGRLNRRAA
ncbi:uncharacterized protein LOC103702651 [Phoenix dactylifera]|uniref:Uncharacterized protein LOC103702651 n=1 Tax=Phoenix dactylifera TaxID=42345 RepID=A0A8B7BQN7_PHODC|nr:uncharacterized protein LOC103702651 [Phoenix dactylifera]